MGLAENRAHRSPAADVARRRAGADGAHAPRPPILVGVTSPGMSALQQIQRCAGNRVAERVLTAEGDGRLYRCGPVPCNCSAEERQAKEGRSKTLYDGLPVSHPAEPAEREADEVADRVMRMRDDDQPVHIGPAGSGAMHRCAEDAADAPHGASGNGGPEPASNTGLAAGIARQVRGGGQALGGGLRQYMEARFGRDLGPVQVHTDAAAGRLARQVDAHAFTVGQHVFFAPGRYQPDDHAGRRLLAHELTHVVQQSAGPAPATVRRQARTDSQPQAAQAPVPAEKTSSTLESAYRRLGDNRRAAAIRSCREHGGGACNFVLTQNEVRNLYQLAQRSGGDERKIRAGLQAAAPAALGVLPVAATLAPGLPPVGPVPPFAPPPVLAPPVGAPGYPTWAPPPPVSTAPAAEVATAEVATAEVASGAAVSATAVAAVAAVAVVALVAACVLVVFEAWQFSKFEQELEAKGFVVLDDALQKCISGCHASAQELTRPFPELDLPFRPLPDFPLPARPFPHWPDIETGRPRPPWEDPDREEPDERRKERRRDRRKDTGPDIDIDPRTRRKPKDPCDVSLFYPCDGTMTFEEAHEIVKAGQDFKGAKTSGEEAVSDGACWVDGRPRSRAQALAVRAIHQTWNTPGGKKVATIKCCPCCMRGGTGAVLQHCTIN